MKPTIQQINQDVERALIEDLGDGDITAQLLPDDLIVRAEIISRESMFVCGQAWVDASFTHIDPSVQINWLVDEGTWLLQPRTLCVITGLARSILTAERTALNFLQTLSATATQTYQYLQLIKEYDVQLLDTRKTIPGLRMAQKYAVFCAGGMNHRMGLYDAYLIKENHIKACGSITAAINKARQLEGHCLLEVEVENIDQLREALQAKPDRILLDNFNYNMLLEAVAINQSFSCQLEVSGGVGLDTIVNIAKTGVHYISVGAITKSIHAIDLSLLIMDTL
ncbi:MAG: carboxylating nicotinate-nucleotide diphosphorylase [Legionella sp.]